MSLGALVASLLAKPTAVLAKPVSTTTTTATSAKLTAPLTLSKVVTAPALLISSALTPARPSLTTAAVISPPKPALTVESIFAKPSTPVDIAAPPRVAPTVERVLAAPVKAPAVEISAPPRVLVSDAIKVSTPITGTDSPIEKAIASVVSILSSPSSPAPAAKSVGKDSKPMATYMIDPKTGRRVLKPSTQRRAVQVVARSSKRAAPTAAASRRAVSKVSRAPATRRAQPALRAGTRPAAATRTGTAGRTPAAPAMRLASSGGGLLDKLFGKTTLTSSEMTATAGRPSTGGSRLRSDSGAGMTVQGGATTVGARLVQKMPLLDTSTPAYRAPSKVVASPSAAPPVLGSGDGQVLLDAAGMRLATPQVSLVGSRVTTGSSDSSLLAGMLAAQQAAAMQPGGAGGGTGGGAAGGEAAASGEQADRSEAGYPDEDTEEEDLDIFEEDEEPTEDEEGEEGEDDEEPAEGEEPVDFEDVMDDMAVGDVFYESGTSVVPPLAVGGGLGVLPIARPMMPLPLPRPATPVTPPRASVSSSVGGALACVGLGLLVGYVIFGE